jgi:hypothetical protein
MKNLNLKLFITFAINNKPDKKRKEKNHLIYSMVSTTSYYEINYTMLTKRLKLLKCKKFYLYDVIPYGNNKASLINDEFINYLPISENNPYYVVQLYPLLIYLNLNFLIQY